jgi:hypothetical protein
LTGSISKSGWTHTWGGDCCGKCEWKVPHCCPLMVIQHIRFWFTHLKTHFIRFSVRFFLFVFDIDFDLGMVIWNLFVLVDCDESDCGAYLYLILQDYGIWFVKIFVELNLLCMFILFMKFLWLVEWSSIIK